MKYLFRQLGIIVLCLIIVWLSLRGAGYDGAGGGFGGDGAGGGVGASSNRLVVRSGTGMAVAQSGAAQTDVAASKPVGARSELAVGDTVTVNDRDPLIIVAPGDVVVRVAPRAVIRVLAGDVSSYRFMLNSGRVWASAFNGIGSATVLVPEGVMIASDFGSFDVVRNDDNAQVTAGVHPVRVGLFLPGDADVSSGARSAVPSLLNELLLAEAGRVTVPYAKIQPSLDKLLYSKIAKEFRYSPVSDDEWRSDSWLQDNLNRDRDERSLLIARFADDVRNRGLTLANVQGSLYAVRQVVRDVRQVVTFNDTMLLRAEVDDILTYFDDALFFATTSQSAAARERFDLFKNTLFTRRISPSVVGYVRDELLARFHRLLIAGPDQPLLFQLRGQLRDALLDAHPDVIRLTFPQAISLVRTYLDDVERARTNDTVLAQTFLTAYFKRSGVLLDQFASDIARAPHVVAEDSQLLTALFLKDSLFYRDSFITQKLLMEQRWLALITDDRARREERQTLVAYHVDIIKRLRIFFFGDRLAIADARSVLFRLMNAIMTSMPDTDAAVAQYFQDNLDAQQDFWAYLNAQDFTDSTRYGATHTERFSAFVAAQKDNTTLQGFQQQLFGSAVGNGTGVAGAGAGAGADLRVSLATIRKAFADIGVEKLVVAPLIDPGQQYVAVDSAEYLGVPFSAVYNRDKQLISDVIVKGQLILNSALPLKQLPMIFKTTSVAGSGVSGEAAVSSAAGSTPEAIPDDRIEKVARLLVLKKLTDLGFTLDEQAIGVEDFAAKRFVIRDVILPYDKEKIGVTFSLDLPKALATNINVHILSGISSMPDAVPLNSLPQAITAFYEKEFYAAVDRTLGTTPAPTTPAPADATTNAINRPSPAAPAPAPSPAPAPAQ